MGKYCIIGNDERTLMLRKMYIAEEKKIVDLEYADYVITSIPFSRDGINLTGENIKVNEFLNRLDGKILFTGAINENIKEKLKSICYYDLMDMEEIAILNAIPTAEGAIYEAIKNSNITLYNSNVLVLGYGKIGKILSRMLKGIGAKVYCEARNKKDIAFINSLGYNSVRLEDINSYLPKMDYIFNTIPHVILNKEEIKYINTDCTIIDLASAPGGIDFSYARKKNLNVIWALAMPSKVAPKSSARYLKDSIDKIIYDKEKSSVS